MKTLTEMSRSDPEWVMTAFQAMEGPAYPSDPAKALASPTPYTVVDYALRRRFTFMDLKPAFGNERFHAHLLQTGVDEALVHRLDARMRKLSEAIRTDASHLGPGFEVGHSYFVPGPGDEAPDEAWYRTIIEDEVRPLLREYWFDQPKQAREQVDQLLA